MKFNRLNIALILALSMLVIAVGFNLWIYRMEVTSKVDPNDNPFQYALVERTNQMWDYAGEKCGINPLCFSSYLIDHWVPNWAQGYSLPYYYSHAPQIAIVASYRLISFVAPSYSLFTHYHYTIYLLLCLFPLAVFIALKKIQLPILFAGIGALVASQISTDGLYGLDPSSFLWRGYGLTSQLFAMPWLPLALGYFFKYLHDPKPIPVVWPFQGSKKQMIINWLHYIQSSGLIMTILLLVLAISGHLGLGVILLLSLGILTIARPIRMLLEKQPFEDVKNVTINHFSKLTIVAGSALFLLSYWIALAFLNDKYHNISFWDPVWKFNSWGWKEVMNYFLNGNLFDFGRFPVLTIIIVIACIAVWKSITRTKDKAINSNLEEPTNISDYSPFAILFIFWLIMFFGRATWGGLIDIIPGMKEFHQSRFIVGVHLTGFFLIPLGLWHIHTHLIQSALLIKNILIKGVGEINKKQKFIVRDVWIITSVFFLGLFIIITTYPQTQRYALFNDVLIARGNDNFNKQNADVVTLFKELNKLQPGRVFTGRGGSWGKKLQLAETTYYMHLSTFGVPVILWLPETWSPNSDIEQFFIEERADHYDLMNVRYVVTPPDLTPQPFWKFISETPQWKLYSTQTSGYFGVGARAATIKIEKTSYINLVRLWLQSDYPKQQLFPEMTFSKTRMLESVIPAFEMTDEASYKIRDGQTFGLFSNQPTYEAPQPNLRLVGPETVKSDMEFSTIVEVDQKCTQCMVFLKHSFHPNWKATIDGKPVATFISFPYYIGIPLETPGKHTISYYYQPSSIKMILFTISLAIVLIIGVLFVLFRKNTIKPTKSAS